MSRNFYNTQLADPNQEDITEGYRQWRRIRTAKYLISSTLALVGLIILSSQLGPLGVSYVQGILLEKQAGQIKDPAPAQVLTPDKGDLPYYDPGTSYFRNLIAHIGSASVAGVSSDGIYPDQQEIIPVDTDYANSMKIFIPAIGISDITITPNVDSLNEKTYNAALKNGLAHFQGTPIPGDGGNSFIYGHSAVNFFFSRHPNDPETIFSRLEQIEIADTISIERDGETLTYVVQKKKITSPNDFDVILGTTDKETITLMTCWPLGIGSKRLIVIAERTNG